MRQAERRAQTRQRLLDAAAEVLARRGFHTATLDEIADAAGYTKGAVYSNFSSKVELFLALLDRHLDDQIAHVERLTATASRERADVQTELRSASAKHMSSGSAFGLLMLEFWLYAARNDEVKAALATRYRRMRERLAAAITENAGESQATETRSPDEAATLVLALDAGLFLQTILDPDAVTPELRARAITDVLYSAHGDVRSEKF
ncbi:MAG TPA: TetR family transcriptional regulator [Actinopolymorphaceae bacterium]|mgnify:CR=1 FL=1